jgi:uncharacterized membrane protein YeaQ/YmgE (transglycosylase-associated protein family)
MIALLVILVVLLIVFPIIGFAVSALISVVIVGGIIGALARLVLPGRQDIGVFATIVLGWIGSLVGGFVGYRVLHVNGFLRVLLEIGVAAVLVAIASSGAGNSLARRDRTLRY